MTQMQAKTFQDFVADAKTRIREVTQDQLHMWIDNNKDMVIIDVREANDHSHGRIEKAVNIPRGVIELEIDESVPDKNKTVVLYCGGGSRSALAADVLQQMGYTDVYSLQGGYRNWSDKPFPAYETTEYNTPDT